MHELVKKGMCMELWECVGRSREKVIVAEVALTMVRREV